MIYKRTVIPWRRRSIWQVLEHTAERYTILRFRITLAPHVMHMQTSTPWCRRDIWQVLEHTAVRESRAVIVIVIVVLVVLVAIIIIIIRLLLLLLLLLIIIIMIIIEPRSLEHPPCVAWRPRSQRSRNWLLLCSKLRS